MNREPRNKGFTLTAFVTIVSVLLVVGGIVFFALQPKTIPPKKEVSQKGIPQPLTEGTQTPETEGIDPFFLEGQSQSGQDIETSDEFPHGKPSLDF